MILLYTGADTPDVPQINADKSLGGYVSSTQVPNGRLANLFPSISKSDVKNKRSLIRMVALKNTTGAEVTGVTLQTDSANSHVKLKLAAVAPVLDANNNPVFESVQDGGSLPYQAVLDYHEAGLTIDIESIANNAVIGIWILREIDDTKFPELTTKATGKELADLLEAAQANGEESISLQISYS
jgi:hypothetical protein